MIRTSSANVFSYEDNSDGSFDIGLSIRPFCFDPAVLGSGTRYGRLGSFPSAGGGKAVGGGGDGSAAAVTFGSADKLNNREGEQIISRSALLCLKCSAYFNCYCDVREDMKAWRCNICDEENELESPAALHDEMKSPMSLFVEQIFADQLSNVDTHDVNYSEGMSYILVIDSSLCDDRDRYLKFFDSVIQNIQQTSRLAIIIANRNASSSGVVILRLADLLDCEVLTGDCIASSDLASEKQVGGQYYSSISNIGSNAGRYFIPYSMLSGGLRRTDGRRDIIDIIRNSLVMFGNQDRCCSKVTKSKGISSSSSQSRAPSRSNISVCDLTHICNVISKMHLGTGTRKPCRAIFSMASLPLLKSKGHVDAMSCNYDSSQYLDLAKSCLNNRIFCDFFYCPSLHSSNFLARGERGQIEDVLLLYCLHTFLSLSGGHFVNGALFDSPEIIDSVASIIRDHAAGIRIGSNLESDPEFPYSGFSNTLTAVEIRTNSSRLNLSKETSSSSSSSGSSNIGCSGFSPLLVDSMVGYVLPIETFAADCRIPSMFPGISNSKSSSSNNIGNSSINCNENDRKIAHGVDLSHVQNSFDLSAGHVREKASIISTINRLNETVSNSSNCVIGYFSRRNQRACVSVRIANLLNDSAHNESQSSADTLGKKFVYLQVVVRFISFLKSTGSDSSLLTSSPFRLHKITRVHTIQIEVCRDIVKYFSGFDSALFSTVLIKGIVADFHDKILDIMKILNESSDSRSSSSSSALVGYASVTKATVAMLSKARNDFVKKIDQYARGLSRQWISGARNSTIEACLLFIVKCLYFLREGLLILGPSLSSIDSFYHRWFFLSSDSQSEAVTAICPKVSLVDLQFINAMESNFPPSASSGVDENSNSNSNSERFCAWFHNSENNSKMLTSQEPFNLSLLPDYVAVVDCGDYVVVRPGADIIITDTTTSAKESVSSSGAVSGANVILLSKYTLFCDKLRIYFLKFLGRSPAPRLIFLHSSHNALQRFVMARLSPMHSCSREIQMAYIPELLNYSAEVVKALVDSMSFTDQISFHHYLLEIAPVLTQKKAETAGVAMSSGVKSEVMMNREVGSNIFGGSGGAKQTSTSKSTTDGSVSSPYFDRQSSSAQNNTNNTTALGDDYSSI